MIFQSEAHKNGERLCFCTAISLSFSLLAPLKANDEAKTKEKNNKFTSRAQVRSRSRILIK